MMRRKASLPWLRTTRNGDDMTLDDKFVSAVNAVRGTFGAFAIPTKELEDSLDWTRHIPQTIGLRAALAAISAILGHATVKKDTILMKVLLCTDSLNQARQLAAIFGTPETGPADVERLTIRGKEVLAVQLPPWFMAPFREAQFRSIHGHSQDLPAP